MSTPDQWWGEPGCYPVAEGVHRIPLSMPNDGLRAVNVYALEAGDRLVLIDGGWAIESATQELDDALSRIGRSAHEISDIYVTHIHRDHYTFAVRLREKLGVRIHLGLHEKPGLDELHGLRNNVPTSAVREMKRAGVPALAHTIEERMLGEPFDLADWAHPDSWIEPGRLPVEGWNLEAVHTPGHTKGHIVFHDRDRGIVFTGDHVLPTITPSIGFELGDWDLPLGHYLSSLQLMLDRDDAVMLPAHGHVAPSVHERLHVLLAHHEERFGRILDYVGSVDRPVLGHEVAQHLPWTRRETPFANLDTFNAMIAVCETMAHLDVLVVRGDLEVTVIENVAHFRRASGLV